MRIQVDQKKLSKHINIVQKGISSKTTLPILDGILLEAKDGKLKLTGTDLEIGIESYLEANILEEGSIVINSRLFGDIIKKLPNSEIDINVSENKMNIVCDSSQFNLIGNSSVEYPELPTLIDQLSLKIPMDLFKDIIRQTVFATTQDETRPILTGVLFEVIDGNASFVALDGYRLSLRNIKINSSEDVKVVIPGRTLSELNKILEENEEDIEITLTPGHIVFNIGDTLVFSRLLEGQFLNYRDIIREDHDTRIKVNRKELQDSLERASLLAKEEKANLVKLNLFEDKLTIKSNSEIGNVHEEMTVELEGEDVDIAFNSKYILDGIKAMDEEEIELFFMGSLNPCIIKPAEEDNYTYLVLPVRLAKDDY
ncbi:DNA polymerase III subunit beta [Anaerosalibacter massiliensis]|uniref:Beta sliding clamp n=1 Tax=Anaerosalibacter massiliensis TaxID=1347392 RepID=A0A9X2MQN5_9FIRM|nr:DNA polymerase III subunit beta [Anaerosalibacter massiliensis]MCR2045441.1 DNA polymerase III subunit beta [Anaerosalibacter massiliensis]